MASPLFAPFEVHRAVLPFALNERLLFGMGCEVGVAEGYFARHTLAHWGGFLYLVDPYENLPDYDESYPQEENLAEMRENLKAYEDRYELVRKPSLAAAADFTDEFFDYVYLDGNHRYEAVRDDLNAWWPKLKKGGLFAGDDYGCFPEMPVDFGHGELYFSVKRAVDEWALKNKRNISIDWQADWDCKGVMRGPDSETTFEVRARNWWLIK
jgi:Methyltransferase domain